MLQRLFSAIGQMRGAASGISELGSNLSKLGSRASKSYSRFRKRGGLAGEVNRLRMRAHLSIDSMGFVKGVAKAMAVGVENMANDVREKTVNYIMGNRKNPMNVYPKNKVNPRTGAYYKNSIARPWPQPPKSYVKPGDPIAITQVSYAKTDRKQQMRVQGGSVEVPSYIVGPIGTGRKASGNKLAVPGVLEFGGTTRAFYRQVNANGGVARWEFLKTKKTQEEIASKRKNIPKGAKTPVRYSSWSEVNNVMRKRGQKIGGAITYGELANTKFDPGAGWKGPMTFRVKARPYVSRAWQKTQKRTRKFIGDAKQVLPSYMARNIKLQFKGKPRKRK